MVLTFGAFRPTLPVRMFRTLENPAMASARIFEQAPPTYNPLKLPSGVKHLRKARKGPTLERYWPKFPEYQRFNGYYYVTDEYRRKIMKMFEDEKRGKAKPIKGEGKRKQVAGKKAATKAADKKE
mmetsp:Transcript_4836/g.6753  ORF Transcript_4836/g.6753 Transcript_4836/m.6753 type:complete len:125 (-) Transcript_4836:171-545(-)